MQPGGQKKRLKGYLITVAKLFAQGIPFAFLAFIAVLVWARIFQSFAGLDAWLYLVGVMVLLAIGWGVLNILLTYALWFPVEHGWKSFVPQGLILFACIFAIDILPLHFLVTPLANLGYVPYVVGFVVINLLYAFADGWIAMKLGPHWKIRGIPTAAEDYVAFTPEPPIPVDNPKALHCPRCGKTNLVVAKDNSAYCLDCDRGIRKERLGGTAG